MTAIFTPKPFAEIVAAEVERVRLSTDLLTDFNVGSVVRSLLEANAVELDDYYQEMYLGLQRAIPQAIYLGFGFEQLPATAAAGMAVFTRIPDSPDDPIIIPAGTRLVNLAGAYFVTEAAVTLAEGVSTGSVAITAEIPGAVGNSGLNSLLLVNDTGWYSVTNPAILSGGQDAESEEQRAERFRAYIRALARGTPASLEYAATIPARYHAQTGVLIERVQRAGVYETPGHVELYIHNGSYGASTELLAMVQTLVDGYRDPLTDTWVGGYRPAGMRVEVKPMVDQAVDISLELSAGVGTNQATLTAAVTTQLAAWLRAALPGRQVRPIDIINVALGVEGITAATLVTPTSTITVAASTVLALGELTLTWTA